MNANEILEACAAGRLPPTIALMHLIGATPNEADFAGRIAEAKARPGASPLRVLCALADRNPRCWRLAHDMIATVDHESSASIGRLAAMFDDAVSLSPAASVALYSLGDEQALHLATQEIVALMRAAQLVGPEKDMLDLGCGIGRFVHALAPQMRHVTGLDISAKMIDEAQRRCAGLENVRLATSSGRDLASVDDRSMDVILAADVFPYLVQVNMELAATHVREAGRCLRKGGAMLILNFSYRGDLARDTEDLQRMLPGADLERADPPALTLAHWDAAPFLLRKHA